MRVSAAALAVGLAVFAGSQASCRPAGEAPVAELRVDPRQLSLPYPGYREMLIDLTPLAELHSLDGGGQAGAHSGGRPKVEPILFIHLVGEPGEVLRTFDHPLPESWTIDRPMRYPVRLYQSAMARPLPAGRYQLTAGLYEASGRRWPLATAGEEVDRDEYRVAEVTVPEASGATEGDQALRFTFSPDWSPVDVGSDRQVLARRWLGGPGTIELAGVKRPGLLWLLVQIPPSPENGARVLGEGESDPAVLVRSTCGGVEVAVSGVGRQEVELPVTPMMVSTFDPTSAPTPETTAETPAETAPCTVEFTPTFYDQREGSFDRRSVALEALAWMER